MEKNSKMSIIFSILLFAFALACGPGGDDGGLFGGPPGKPDHPTPGNGQEGVTLNQTLNWYGYDDQGIFGGSESSYRVYLEKNNTYPQIMVANTGNKTYYEPNNLEPNSDYYWRIEAYNNNGTTESDVWHFKTVELGKKQEGPPFPPAFPYPFPDTDNNAYQKLSLFWSGGDPDPKDYVNYDLYFDTSFEGLTKVATDIPVSRFDTANLEQNKKYYWQVVARDSQGNETHGTVWSFKTGNFTSLPDNFSPYPPFDPQPFNGHGGQPEYLALSWNAEDPDPYDTLSFDVYLDNTFNEEGKPIKLVAKDISSKTYKNQDVLDKDNLYRWVIVARDNHGNETPGPVWEFYTGNWYGGGEGNPPFMPSNPKPYNGDWDVPTLPSLSWDGGDPDGDAVDYTIYLGLPNPNNPDPYYLPKIGETYYNNTYYKIPYDNELEQNKAYNWYIVARDNNGNETHGPIWSFTTGGSYINGPPWVHSPWPGDGEDWVPGWIILSWAGGDPDGDYVEYNIYFGETYPLVYEGTTGANNYDINMAIGNKTLKDKTEYMWQIIAIDSFSNQTIGPVWHFTTGSFGGKNQPPFKPGWPWPDHSEEDIPNNVVLSWSGGDPDGDYTTYDIYFGTTQNVYPDYKIGSTSGEPPAFAVDGLLDHTKYYWKVVATDSYGNHTDGDLWWFITGQGNAPPQIDSVPYNPYSGENVGTDVWLSWDAWDPEGDYIVCDIYLATEDNMDQLLDTTTLVGSIYSTNWSVTGLDKDTQYFWQIKTTEVYTEDNKSTAGPIWSFYTNPGNSPPVEPYNPYPPSGEANVEDNPVLSWNGYDPDGNMGIYDLYFGTDPELFIHVYSGADTFYPLSDLTQGTTYYWYVIAEDTDFERTNGPIWNFTVLGTTVSGATLIDVIDTGLPDTIESRHFGLSYYDSALYLTGYGDNSLTKILLANHEVAPGYPKHLSYTDGPHGLAVDEADGSIWVCDLNNTKIRHYDTSVNLISSTTIGSQPVNAIIYGDQIYIADRKLDKIFVMNKTTLSIENSFQVTGMNAYESGGYVDLFIYSNKLFIVADEINGIVRMNLDGTEQEMILVQKDNFYGAFSIYIQNDKIYLCSDNEITITDLSGNILNYWYVDRPEGFTGPYIEIEVINDKIYVASYHRWDEDTRTPHILVYENPFYKLIFSDNFEENDFNSKWISGSSGEEFPNTIANVNGRIRATENSNYIETKEEFTGDLRIEVDVEKEGNLNYTCWDFYVEIISNGATGVIRFDEDGIDGINVSNNGSCGDKVWINPLSPNKGKAVLTYTAPYAQFSFTNENGDVLETDKIYASSFGTSKIRIWLAGYSDSPRYIDNVKIYSLGQP